MAHVRIFKHYVRTPFLVLALVEYLVLVACAYLGIAWWGWINIDSTQYGLDPFALRYAVVFGVVMLLSTVALGVYESGVKESFGSMAVRCVVSYCLLGSGALVLLFYLVPDFQVGRRPLFISVALSFFVVLLIRFVFFRVVGAEALRRRILVLGAGQKAAHLAVCSDINSASFDIAGFIPASAEGMEVEESRILNVAGGLFDIVEKYHVDEIVTAVDERRRDKGGYYPIEELLECKMKGIRITESVRFYERELGRIELDEIHPGWMVFGDGFSFSQLRESAKRGFDILVAILLVLLTMPLMLLAVLAIVLETGRPVIYKQTRVGLNGRHFEIYKFRSMTQNAEKDGGAQWAKANDTRVTRVGAFIRNTRIDELPQLWNVLRGEMSFVGPRPERPEFVEDLVKELPYYDFRHRVKPGLVGWAQLNYPYGASIEDAQHKLVYDLYYLKNHSFLLDLIICIQTVEVVLLGKGVR